MNGTQIGPRIVFVVCSVAALPAVSSGSPQAGAQERAEFGAFYDKVTRAEAELFQGVLSPSRSSGLAPPMSRSLASPAGVASMAGTRSGHDSTGRIRNTPMGSARRGSSDAS